MKTSPTVITTAAIAAIAIDTINLVADFVFLLLMQASARHYRISR
jgi:hypothetical protein